MDLKIKILAEAIDKMSAPFKSMKRASDDMGASLNQAAARVRDLEMTGANIEAFGQLQAKAKANSEALAAAQEKAQKMGQALAGVENPTKKAAVAFDRARAEVNRLEAAGVAVAREQGVLRDRLAAAGISTDRLGIAQRRLKFDLAAAKGEAEKQAQALDRARKAADGLAQARSKMEKSQAMAARMGVSGAVAMGAGTGVLASGLPALNKAGDMEEALTAYKLVAGADAGNMDVLREKLITLSEQVNQSAPALLNGLSIMVGKGMKPDEALSNLDLVGRAVTATGASMEDMSALAFSVRDNLKVINPSQLAQVFDAMAKAGDEGGFELKNMATYFPQLTASAYSLGMVGPKAVSSLAAALQVATKGAADPAEAANNMANFLKALTGKEAVKNFNAVGIDVKAAIQKGLMEGEDPIETMMKTVGKGIGVDLTKEMNAAMADGLDPKAAAERVAGRFNLAELFGDAQAQNFLAPMLANMGKYREIRDKALAAQGSVDQKFAEMIKTYNQTKQGLGNDFDNTLTRLGTALLPIITPLANGLRSVVQGIGAFAAANPNLTATIMVVVGGLAALVAIGGAVTVGLAALIGPFALVKFGLAAMAIQGGVATGALGLLGSVGSGALGLLAGGIRLVSAAFMANPIVAAIALITAGLVALYNYFEPFQKLVDGIFSTIKGIFGFSDKKPPLADMAQAAPAKIAAAPSGKVISTSAIAASVAAPLASAAAMPAQINTGGNSYSISITAAPGQSADDIAKLVRAEIEKHDRAKGQAARSRLYDQE